MGLDRRCWGDGWRCWLGGLLSVLHPRRFVDAVGGKRHRGQVLARQVGQRGVLAGAHHFA